MFVSKLIIKTNKDVFDIGCGPSHISDILFDNNFEKKYTGIDFSVIAIEMAKSKRRPINYEYIVSDIRTYDYNKVSNDSIFISIETFEHLSDDLSIIDKLPKNSDLILSVPNFKSKNHYRTYDSVEQIKEYYNGYLEISNVEEFKLSNTSSIFVIISKII